MKISQRTVYLILSLIVSVYFFSSCSPYPDADYYEVDGIISIAPKSDDTHLNWQKTFHVNSHGLTFRPSEPDSSRNLSYTFYVINPGSYHLHVLTTGFGVHDENSAGMDLTILGQDGFLIDRSTLHLPQDDRLRWVPFGEGSGSDSGLNFTEPGFYEIQINPLDHSGLQIHKLHLSHSDYVKPFGIGLPVSLSTEVNSADLFREQPVMLPPDWFFGLMFGYSNTASVRESGETGSTVMKPDAAWFTHSDDTFPQEFRDPADKNIKWGRRFQSDSISQKGENSDLFEWVEHQYHFNLLNGPVSQADLKHFYDEERSEFPEHERSLYLRSYYSGNDSYQLEFPAMKTEPIPFSWDSAPKVDQDGKLTPGGLQQLLESVSDPTFSIYGTPFISFPIDLRGNTDEELFYRAIQLSAFLPSMHLMTEDLSSDSFTDSEIEIFQEYVDLRSRLFPYIYTHAHVTRQTGRSLIAGFREYPGQFRFGDAFLVAPITEHGSRERSVYFPGEGLWYDYYSGREYRGGQSWMIEAPLRQLPLFVKAGSVIPYRKDGGNIRSGSNNPLIVEIYTGDAGSFRLTEDDGATRDYRRAIAARTMFRYNEVAGQLRLTIGAVQREYSGMDEFRSYELRFMYTEPPESVEINGERMVESQNRDQTGLHWHYDEETGTLILNLPDRWKHERTEIAITP